MSAPRVKRARTTSPPTPVALEAAAARAHERENERERAPPLAVPAPEALARHACQAIAPLAPHERSRPLAALLAAQQTCGAPLRLQRWLQRCHGASGTCGTTASQCENCERFYCENHRRVMPQCVNRACTENTAVCCRACARYTCRLCAGPLCSACTLHMPSGHAFVCNQCARYAEMAPA